MSTRRIVYFCILMDSLVALVFLYADIYQVWSWAVAYWTLLSHQNAQNYLLTCIIFFCSFSLTIWIDKCWTLKSLTLNIEKLKYQTFRKAPLKVGKMSNAWLFLHNLCDMCPNKLDVHITQVVCYWMMDWVVTYTRGRYGFKIWQKKIWIMALTSMS